MKSLSNKIYLLVILFFIGITIQGQTSPEINEHLKSISKYLTGKSLRTDQLLKKIGYTPQEHLIRDFSKFPTLRKLSIAYHAADKGTKRGGQIFLSKLYESLTGKYQAIRSEQNLKLINPNLARSDLIFKHTTTGKPPQLSKTIKNQLLAISKYTETGGLGGTRGILKHKFRLPDHQVYDLLSGSKSNFEALKKGIDIAKRPPSQKERVKKIALEINRKYQSASLDPKLQKIIGESEKIRFKKTTKEYPKSYWHKDFDASNNNRAYKKFIDINYPKKINMSFHKMKFRAFGFGGIIFGNDLVDSTGLGDINFIRHIPLEQVSRSGDQLVDIELVFTNGDEVLVSSVLVEDVIAAHKLLYDMDYPFIEGDGLGILSIEPVLHPAIVNLPLADILYYCDEFPGIGYLNSFTNIESSNDVLKARVKEFVNKMDEYYFLGNYKLTDVPLKIQYQNGELVFERNDSIPNQLNSFITLISPDDGINAEIKFFYEFLPTLTKINYELNRFNEFARIFSILRWAKRKNGKLLNLPEIEILD